jgi:2-polyprenyl-3-methyl-5-hydroxy-6-metoxy-1,4-benzoquinol methylase
MNRQQQRARANDDDTLTRLRTVVAADPRDAKARNQLGSALYAQGKIAEASEQFACALSLMPELFQRYEQIVPTLLQINPGLRGAMALLTSGSAARAKLEAWMGQSEFPVLARDPLFRTVLESSPVRDMQLERLLTAMRRILLDAAAVSGGGDRVDKARLEFCCALARQCFVNEYVFDLEPGEEEQVQLLREKLVDQLTKGGPVPAGWVALLASYVPLASIPSAKLLLERTWPSAVRAVLRQQLVEPEEERQCRQSIPSLTPIENSVSVSVRHQYEENPYPRWVAPASAGKPVTLYDYLRQQFPSAELREPSAGGECLDVLVAGCGTGHQSVATARRFIGARVLAIDLSLSSLAYAKRMTEALDVHNIEYAQADILNLGSFGRTFDLIEASGVLHHMEDPMAGWRNLLALLRPGGFMNVALYSKIGRQLVQSAREHVVQKGYGSTAEDIRRLRQELLLTPLRAVTQWNDFYTTSECRDLLFHVQEHQTSIPEIQSFIEEHRLSFIGFHLQPQVAAAYRRRFPDDVSLTDLPSWSSFEAENPYTFASMYQFWVQKS